MLQGTTPDYTLRLACDLSDKTVYVTFEQGNIVFTKTNIADDMTITVDTSGQTPSSTIEIRLSQQDTLKLKEGTADVQVKWIDVDGITDGTYTKPVSVERALLKKVIEYVDRST